MVANNVPAMSLADAKSKGYVVEQPDGYLGVGGSAPADARALAQDVNAKRRAEYERIANKTNSTTDQVARLMAKKLAESGR